jgi:hypothetical protein
LRRFSFSLICLATALAALIGAGAADAEIHLGSAVQPAGSTPRPCGLGAVFIQGTMGPSISYTVPAESGKLTSWEVNTVSSTVGAPLTLVVLRPAWEGSYEVVATDAETLPSPLPAGGVAAFALASPIAVEPGDTFGLSLDAPGANCFFEGGATSSLDELEGFLSSGPVVPGETLQPYGRSAGGYRLNLALTLRTEQEVGVTTTASPATATVGAFAVLGSTVAGHGPDSGPITFTDTVPAGLRVDSAVAGSGACTTTGQTVVCTIEGLAAGESAPVEVLVTPTAAGSYANTVSVAPQPGTADPAPADDSASATLDVAAASMTTSTKKATDKTPTTDTTARACVVPDLRRVRVANARRLLGPLGCKAGKVRRVHNRKIAKGKVIRTSPKPGTYVAGLRVGLVVSSGPSRHRHRHQRHP